MSADVSELQVTVSDSSAGFRNWSVSSEGAESAGREAGAAGVSRDTPSSNSAPADSLWGV